MPPVVVYAVGSLTKFLPKGTPQPVTLFPPERTSVKDLTESMGIPHTEIGRLTLNREEVDFSTLLTGTENSVIDLFPDEKAFHTSPTPLRPPLLVPPRFLCDVHLGKLARYLRLLGFDTLYTNNAKDAELAAVAAEQERILTTRDRALLMRKNVTFGAYIWSSNPRNQIAELRERYDLTRWALPLTRCPNCNSVLEPVDKREVVAILKPQTRAHIETFTRCRVCQNIYWEGAHFHRLGPLVESLLFGVSQ